jgi:hypothetical protein
MRILTVSKHLAVTAKTRAYGIYKRLDMLVEALSGIGELDMLFYVPAGLDISEPARARYQAACEQRWGVPIALTLCHLKQTNQTPSAWSHYGAPIFSLNRHLAFFNVCGEEQVGAFRSCLARAPDFIFAHRLYSMLPAQLANKPTPPIWLDLDDIEHLSFLRDLAQPPSWPGKRLGYLQLPALLLGELRAIRAAALTLVCSEKDRAYLSRLSCSPNVQLVPNAVSIPESNPLPAAPNMVFLGAYTYAPNANAADFLIREIWPHVRAAIPHANLRWQRAGEHRVLSYSPGGCAVHWVCRGLGRALF